jgi:UDP-glucuronate 4-epimerase
MYLITGVAGFIGFHVARRLLNTGQEVLGVDTINSSYDPGIKHSRLRLLEGKHGFTFMESQVDMLALQLAVSKVAEPPTVIHLAAQAGVGESMEKPFQCVENNVVAFTHILEFCRKVGVKHLIYASTSAVYGSNNPLPWSTEQNVDNPVSLYAATKKANELMAHVYSNAYGLRTTGLRFFTVYGPWGRPDMAIFKFTKALFEGTPITLFNHGDMSRDFTYVDDIVDGLLSTQTLTTKKLSDVYNIGSGQATKLRDLVTRLEKLTGKKTEIKLADKPVSDLTHSLADIRPMNWDFGYRPMVGIEDGLANFVKWYREYYGC